MCILGLTTLPAILIHFLRCYEDECMVIIFYVYSKGKEDFNIQGIKIMF